MSLVEVLDLWTHICNTVNIRWYLYRETLLCANGFSGYFSNLDYAQVAIHSCDLPTFIQSATSLIPASWLMETQSFSSKVCTLYLTENNKIILSVDVLVSVKDESSHDTLNSEFKKIRAPFIKKQRYRYLSARFFGSRISKFCFPPIPEEAERIASTLISHANTMDPKYPYYTDCLTNSKSALLKKEYFNSIEMLSCDGHMYPVFSGYKEYLSDVYGDYENGLTDNIGVGLTVDEKLDLQNHQQHCKQALTFIQELSEEFGLRYYLLAGSVLGSVRHGNFIPWDDDIDIGIRVEELEAFESVVNEALPKRLPAEFTLKQSGANNPYPRMFSKICYEGRCCIDLWPLVPTYIHGSKANFTWYFAKIITKVHYYKIGHKVTRFLKIVKPMSLLLTDKWVMKLARWNERRYIGKDAPAYINLYSIYRRDKETIKREWLDTPATADFDGIEVPIVGYTEEYLTHLYGDYMSLPAPWKRASRHYERFL